MFHHRGHRGSNGWFRVLFSVLSVSSAVNLYPAKQSANRKEIVISTIAVFIFVYLVSDEIRVV